MVCTCAVPYALYYPYAVLCASLSGMTCAVLYAMRCPRCAAPYPCAVPYGMHLTVPNALCCTVCYALYCALCCSAQSA
jgi:hypothetical protein